MECYYENIGKMSTGVFVVQLSKKETPPSTESEKNVKK